MMRSTIASRRLRRFAYLVAATTIFALALYAQTEGGGESKPAEPNEMLRWANFAILAVGIGYLCAKSFPAIFHGRNQSIQGAIAEARSLKEASDRRAAEVEQKIQTLGSEIERLRAESKAEMQQEGERISQETTQEVARIEAQAQSEIEATVKHSRRELKNYAANLALDLAEKQIQGGLDTNTENGLVDEFVTNLRNQPHVSKEQRN